jgi:hypothetical protein
LSLHVLIASLDDPKAGSRVQVDWHAAPIQYAPSIRPSVVDDTVDALSEVDAKHHPSAVSLD